MVSKEVDRKVKHYIECENFKYYKDLIFEDFISDEALAHKVANEIVPLGSLREEPYFLPVEDWVVGYLNQKWGGDYSRKLEKHGLDFEKAVQVGKKILWAVLYKEIACIP